MMLLKYFFSTIKKKYQNGQMTNVHLNTLLESIFDNSTIAQIITKCCDVLKKNKIYIFRKPALFAVTGIRVAYLLEITLIGKKYPDNEVGIYRFNDMEHTVVWFNCDKITKADCNALGLIMFQLFQEMVNQPINFSCQSACLRMIDDCLANHQLDREELLKQLVTCCPNNLLGNHHDLHCCKNNYFKIISIWSRPSRIPDDIKSVCLDYYCDANTCNDDLCVNSNLNL